MRLLSRDDKQPRDTKRRLIYNEDIQRGGKQIIPAVYGGGTADVKMRGPYPVRAGKRGKITSKEIPAYGETT